jgi:hypothetical protein
MRRNPRITKSQARAMKAVLRAHGFLKKAKKAKRKTRKVRKHRRVVRRTHRRSRR